MERQYKKMQRSLEIHLDEQHMIELETDGDVFKVLLWRREKYDGGREGPRFGKWDCLGSVPATWEAMFDAWLGIREFLFNAPPESFEQMKKVYEGLKGGKIWKAAPPLVFTGQVRDYDAGDFGMTVLTDEETEQSMFGEFLYDYMGKHVKAIVQFLEPAPEGEENK